MALGIFGSLDVNRGDRQSGWDTDQFPNDPTSMALGFYHLFQAGGFTTGGCNFDAKVRRQSLDPDDLLIAHVGGMDVCARALLMAAEMIEDGVLPGLVADRYAGWKTPENQAILKGERSPGRSGGARGPEGDQPLAAFGPAGIPGKPRQPVSVTASVDVAQAASTITISLSSIAVSRSVSSSATATPSRAWARAPLTSTRPLAGTR